MNLVSKYNLEALKMPKKVTIQEIAKRANVSKSTVSKALGNATDINAATRERVLMYASELGYEIKRNKTLQKGKVVTFVEGIDYKNINHFGYELLLGFQAAAGEAHYGVNIISVGGTESIDNYEEIMKNGDYDGSFILGFKPGDEFVMKAAKSGIPAVVLDNDVDGDAIARVGSDSKTGINLIVKHLCGLGHKKIAFIGGEKDSMVTAERHRAFALALKKNGLEYNEKFVDYSAFYAENAPSKLRDIVKSGATAIICASDIIAINCINELLKSGFRVPYDVSVTGYDDIPLAKYSNPALTTVFQNRIHIGRCAFYALLQIMNGVKINKLILRPELVVRQSTATVKII